jgi:hypothetical protein
VRTSPVPRSKTAAGVVRPPVVRPIPTNEAIPTAVARTLAPRRFRVSVDRHGRSGTPEEEEAPMARLKLKLDGLEVESFRTDPQEEAESGTVLAAELPPSYPRTSCGRTCDATCFTDCTCPGFREE